MSGTVHPISIAAQRHTKIGFETQVGSLSRNCAITPSRVSRSTTFPNIQRTSRASQPKPITINVNAFARIPRVYQMRAIAKDWANSPISRVNQVPYQYGAGGAGGLPPRGDGQWKRPPRLRRASPSALIGTIATCPTSLVDAGISL